MPDELFCFIPANGSVFSVDVDKTKSVGWMKKIIKMERPQTLATIEAAALKLYRVVIPESLNNQQQESILTQLSKNLGALEELINTHLLSTIFDQKPPDGTMWVTIAVLPLGELCMPGA